MGTSVALAALAFYWSTRTARPSWDALRYAVAIRDGVVTPAASAHHAVGVPLAWLLWQALHAVGWHIQPLAALELSSAVCAAVALAMLAALLVRRGASAGLAAAIAAGLAVSLSFWRQATDGEVYAPAALALVLAWWALFAVSPDAVWPAARAGAAAGAAVLAHQWNAVLVLWAPLWLWHRAPGARSFCAYGLACLLIATAGYALAWTQSDFSPHPGAFLSWLTHYAQLGFHFPERSIATAATGLISSVVALPGGRSRPPAEVAVGGAALVALLAGLVALSARAVAAARVAAPHDRRACAVAGLVALSAAGLAVAWEPQSLKYWMFSVVSGWLAVGLAFAGASRPPVVGVAALALALGATNYALELGARADPRLNPFPGAARQLAQRTNATDLIIVGADMLAPHLAYDGDRPHASSLFALLWRAGTRGRPVQRELTEVIERARQRGACAFISSDALVMPASRRAAVPTVPDSLAALLPDSRFTPVWTYNLAGSERVLFAIGPCPAHPRHPPAPASARR